MHLMKKVAYATLSPIFNVIFGECKAGKILYSGVRVVGEILRLQREPGATDNQKGPPQIRISDSKHALVAHSKTDSCIPWWSAQIAYQLKRLSAIHDHTLTSLSTDVK